MTPVHQVRDFKQKIWDCDITFIIGNEKVYACKAVLSIASPVFRRTLSGDVDTITLEDANLDHFMEFLQCIYPDMLHEISSTTVYWVLPFVYKYQVQNLKVKCISMLQFIVRKKYKNNAKQLYRHIKLAELYGMDDLAKLCIALASECCLRELEAAQKEHQISSATELIIMKVIISKLERQIKQSDSQARKELT